METNPSLGTLLAIALVAAAAPIVVGLFPRAYLPQVVVGVLAATGSVRAFVPVSLALTTTALARRPPPRRRVRLAPARSRRRHELSEPHTGQ